MVDRDFAHLIMLLRWLESTILESGDGMHNVCERRLCSVVFATAYKKAFAVAPNFCLKWRKWQSRASFTLAHYASNPKHLVLCVGSVVIDSEEAHQTLEVLKLLRWLGAIGLKNVCLYDTEGVLKESKEALELWLKSENLSNGIATNEPLLEQKHMSLEVVSFSDGKDAVAEAANVLLQNHYLCVNTEKPNLKESDMTDALGAIGYGVSEPDLMLVYGPARCHLGFPAWRIRYTEIVHMGPLTSMKCGALIKAIHRFTMVHQNYGT